MIELSDVSGLSFFLLGYGKSGRAARKVLLAGGANVFVWDDKDSLLQEAQDNGCVPADPQTFDFSVLKALIAAPGIPLTHPAPHPAILKARTNDIPVISDLDILFRTCPEATYVGITGTNGKSTTTALIGHVLKEAGRKVEVGGNIGVPALSLNPLGKGGIYVLELSSYQLDLMRTNPLAVAVWLNITPDHIDRHGSMEGYIEAKKKIVRTQGAQTLVLGTDEPEMRALAALFAQRGNIRLSFINELQRIDLSGTIALPGAHNLQNARAAFLACEALGLTRAEIEKGIATFPGLAHRQKLVRENNGVRFVNDSKATNADATSKALVCYNPIYWIAGGKPKTGGLKGLEAFAPRIAHAFLIGQAEAEFANWCQTNGIAHSRCGTLDVATQKAASMAWKDGKKGATVLLSPACASFDQFSGFEERGARFETLALALAP